MQQAGRKVTGTGFTLKGPRLTRFGGGIYFNCSLGQGEIPDRW